MPRPTFRLHKLTASRSTNRWEAYNALSAEFWSLVDQESREGEIAQPGASTAGTWASCRGIQILPLTLAESDGASLRLAEATLRSTAQPYGDAIAICYVPQDGHPYWLLGAWL